ncbi:MAG TPA: hypothetical protein VK811_05540 [Candidatus Acidoferrum sp.]|nr:hypothetical protein [Candidatus Acidoferrum sp.]
MKVYAISETELNERLNLDKRRNSRAFYLCFETLDEAPAGFYERQNELRDGLEKEFWTNFEEGKEDPGHGLIKIVYNKWFFFDGDMYGSERIDIEITDNIIGDKLLGIIMAYLEKSAPNYCVIGAVYREKLTGKNYLGRFVVTCEEIAVEESLVELWTNQVQYMEIEKR